MKQFQSAPRERGERWTTSRRPARNRGVSIRAPRAGRKDTNADGLVFRDVSIRAPRAGRKRAVFAAKAEAVVVSIRAPRAGRKPIVSIEKAWQFLFQSAPRERGESA